MPCTTYAMNLWSIVNAAYRICSDVLSDESYGRIWTWTDMRAAVNRAVIHAVDLAGGLRGAQTIPLLDGVYVYDLPDDCLRLTRVHMYGLQGYVVMPTTITQIDLIGGTRAIRGDPLYFYREFLKPNEIGVLPIPFARGGTSGGWGGSEGDGTFTRDSDYGLLRQITDADGNNLPFDDNLALRQVEGVPFIRTGDGNIIRDLSPSSESWIPGTPGSMGSLEVWYTRTPGKMVEGADYPDTGLPEWFHKDLKYGAAAKLLRYRRNKIDQLRFQWFSMKWLKACMRLKKFIQTQGPMSQQTEAV